MILRRLYELSHRIPDLPPTGYQPTFVTRIIRLDGNGVLRDVIPAGGEKRGKRDGTTMMVPREARTVAVVPCLLCDNPNYVIAKPRDKDKPEQVKARHAAFRFLLDRCADETKEPAVLAVQKWFDDGGADRLRDRLDIEDDDEITFQVEDVRPIDLPEIRKFWSTQGDTPNKGYCLVTGEYGPVVERMPFLIKGVPGGQTSGTALISVNNAAGTSYGLTAALNSPISVDAAERIGNGLNYVLAHDKHRLQVGQKVVYLFWSQSEGGFNPQSMLGHPDPAEVRELILSPRKGVEVSAPEDKDFFVLALSANASRVVVRDFIETTLSSVKENIRNWFELLALPGLDGDSVRPPSLNGLASSLYRDRKDIPPHVPTALLRSALNGTPLPVYLLGLAAKRNLAMQGPYAEFNGNRYLSIDRLALINAVLTQSTGEKIMTTQSDPKDRQAFHCGRLLAVLDSVYIHFVNIDKPKGTKWDRPKSTVSTRYYGAASSSPAAVFGRLILGSRPHLAKLRGGGGKDLNYEEKLEQIAGEIGETFPKTLDVRRQGIFALGYYNQVASDWAAIRNRGIELAEETSGEE
jgi:CRISPR-associated protein Csd1